MTKISYETKKGILIIGFCLAVITVGLYYLTKQQPDICKNNSSHTVLLIKDILSDNQQKFLEQKIEKILDSLKKGELFSIYIIDHVKISPKRIFSECRPLRGKDVDPINDCPECREKEYQKNFIKPIKNIFNRFKRGVSAENPILETIKGLNNVNKFSNKSKERRLIIISDMIQNSERISLYKKDFSFEDFKKDQNYEKLTPDMSGVNIEIYYINSDPQNNCAKHLLFWKSLFNETQPNSVTINEVRENYSINELPENPIFPECGEAPSKPLKLKSTARDRQIKLKWKDVNNVTSYNIYWSTKPDVSKISYTGKIENIIENKFNHKDLKNGKQYYYVVTAKNNIGESELSDKQSAKPFKPSNNKPKKSCLKWMALVDAGVYNIPSDLRQYIGFVGDSIRIVNPFCVLKAEVTVNDFRRFREGAEGEPSKSVENVSWEDAVDYARWVSEKTGGNYHLPTTKQWAAAVIKYHEQYPVIAPDEIPYAGLRNENRPDHLIGNLREWSSDTCIDDGKRFLGENNMPNLKPGSRIDSCAPQRWKGNGVGFRLVREN